MPKTNTNPLTNLVSSSAIELLTWPINTKTKSILTKNRVIALQTTRNAPEETSLKNTHHLNGNSPYYGFNLGLHVQDNVDSVTYNRQYLKHYLEKEIADNIDIQWLEQVHGSEVIEISRYTSQTPVVDASITRNKNIALAIMTADCLPILLCDKNGTEIAAIHGGWRPLAANIIENTLAKMHSDVENIQAWLGPCIGNSAFEVGEEVMLAFTKQSACFDRAFIKQKNGQYLANLHRIAKQQLTDLGIRKIESLAECTYSRADKYYSFRRESITGRMATIICLS